MLLPPDRDQTVRLRQVGTVHSVEVWERVSSTTRGLVRAKTAMEELDKSTQAQREVQVRVLKSRQRPHDGWGSLPMVVSRDGAIPMCVQVPRPGGEVEQCEGRTCWYLGRPPGWGGRGVSWDLSPGKPPPCQPQQPAIQVRVGRSSAEPLPLGPSSTRRPPLLPYEHSYPPEVPAIPILFSQLAHMQVQIRHQRPPITLDLEAHAALLAAQSAGPRDPYSVPSCTQHRLQTTDFGYKIHTTVLRYRLQHRTTQPSAPWADVQIVSCSARLLHTWPPYRHIAMSPYRHAAMPPSAIAK